MALGNFDDLLAAYKKGYDSVSTNLSNAGTIATEAKNVNTSAPTDKFNDPVYTPVEKPKNTAKVGGQSGDTAAGFSGNVEGLKGLYYGVKSLASDALGDEEGLKESYKKFQESNKKAQEINKGKVSTLEDIKWGESGWADRAIDWTQYQLGAAVPSLLVSIGSGLVGAAVGGSGGGAPGVAIGGVAGAFGKNYVQKQISDRVEGIVSKAVKSGVEKTIAMQAAERIAKQQVGKQVGATAGMLASGYAMGLGDIYNETRDEEGRGNILSSFLGAIPYAALDAATEIGVLGKLGKADGPALKRYANAITTSALKEGATESAQEALLMAAAIESGKEISSQEALSRLGNSFAAAAVAGGAMGGAGAAVGGDPLGNAAKEASIQQKLDTTKEQVNQDQQAILDEEAKGLYKEFPDIQKSYVAARRLAQSSRDMQGRGDQEVQGFDTKVKAATTDLEKIYTTKDDNGDYVEKSELKRVQARDAVDRIKSFYQTKEEQTALDEQYVRDTADAVQEVKKIAEVVTPEQAKKPTKKTRGKKNEETSQNAVPTQSPSQGQVSIPTEGQGQVQGQSLLTPAPVAPAPVAEATKIPLKTKGNKAESAPVTTEEAPTTGAPVDRLSAIKNAVKNVQELTGPFDSSSYQLGGLNNLRPYKTADAAENARRTVSKDWEVVEVPGGFALKNPNPVVTAPDPLDVVEQSIASQKLPSNAYGSARGEGYAKETLSAPARAQLAKTYGDNWESEGSMQKGPNGKYFYVPNDPNKQPAVAEKRTRSTGGFKATIPEGVSFSAKKVDRKGNITKEDLFTPATITNSKGTFKTTSNFRMTNGNWEVQLEDGNWVDPEAIGFKTQAQLKNNWSLTRSAPVASQGQTTTTITGESQATTAKREEELAKQNASSLTTSNARKAKEAKQIPVPYSTEDMDWLVSKIKEARENKANKVKDNIKEELETRFGTRSKYKEFENMAMLYAQGILVPENTTTVPVQEATPIQETSTPIPTQGPVETKQPVPKSPEVVKPVESTLNTFVQDTERLKKYLTEDYYFPDSNSYLDPQTDEEIVFGSEQDNINARKRALFASDPAFYNSLDRKNPAPAHAEFAVGEVVPAEDFEIDQHSLRENEVAVETDQFGNNDWSFNLTPYAEDMATQVEWLNQKATEMGYTDVQDLLDRDMNAFVALSGQWRDSHPDVQFSLKELNEFIQRPAENNVAAIKKFEAIAQRFIREVQARNPEVKFKILLTGRDLLATMKAEGWTLNIANKDSMKYAKGYRHNTKNEVGIVLNNHYSSEDVLKTLLHETVGHAGMEGLFGDKWNNFIDRTWNTNPRFAQKAYDRLAKNYLGDVNGNIPAFRSLTRTQKRTLVSEYIAKTSEEWSSDSFREEMEAGNKSFIRRVYAYIKHLLRPFINFEVTDHDINSLIQTAFDRQLGDVKRLADTEQASRILNKQVKKNNIISTPKGEVKIGESIPEGDISIQGAAAWESVESDPVGFAARIEEPLDNITQWQKILHNKNYSGFFGNVRQFTDRLQNKLDGYLDRYTDAFGTMKEKDQAKVRQRIALGDIEATQIATTKFANIVWKKLNSEQKADILKAWKDGRVTRGEFSPAWLSTVQKSALKGLNDIAIGLQNKLVTGNYTNMPDEVKQKIIDSYGTYVHTDYLDSLDKSYYGRGWLPSSLDWMKKKKNLTRKQETDSGAVLDSKYSIVNTINMLAHDIAMFELQKGLVQDSENFNLNWVLQSERRKLTINGEEFTISQLNNRINSLRLSLEETSAAGLTTQEIADKHTELAALESGLSNLSTEVEKDVIENIKQIMWNSGGEYSKLDDNGAPIKGTQKEISDVEAAQFRDNNYTYVKDSAVAGPLKYRWVDNRLYRVLVSESKSMQLEADNWAARTFGLSRDSMLGKATSYWKAHMTVGNLAYWPRAVMGSAFNMDMASDTNSGLLTMYVGKAIKDTFWKPNEATNYAGKTLYQHAVENGLFATGYSTAELYAVREHISRVGAAEKFKKNFSEGDVKGTMGAMFQVMTNGYHEIFKTLSDYNVNIDGVFKMALMRDFLEIHAKQNGYKSAEVMTNAYMKESPAKVAGLMRNAAAYAGKGIIEYHDVPGWVKSLRTVPLGGPFLTFNFKMLGIMQRAMISRPHKLAKYYIAGYFITQALMAAGDWDDDDLKEAYKKLPIHMQNKSSIYVLPFKDKDGQVHYADMSYTLPHSFLVDAVLRVLDPIPGETRSAAAWQSLIQTTGMFGSPVATALTVIKTPNHTDPFTGRDLYKPGDTFEENLARYTKFGWNMAMPPWMHGDVFNTGTGGGIISDTFNANYKDTYGKDKNPYLTTDLASLSGINFRSYRPGDQGKKNRNFIGYKIRQLQTERSVILKDTNLSRDGRVKKVGEVNRKIKELIRQQKEFS